MVHHFKLLENLTSFHTFIITEQIHSMHYDYIIAGSGCAGLSLLYNLLKSPTLKTKKILVLDAEEKVSNDRTWCFWEKENGTFESIVYHKWKRLKFLNQSFHKEFKLQDYSYKMIRGIDFYDFVISYAKGFNNVSFQYEKIISIDSDQEKALVQTDKSSYSSEYVFNSTQLFSPTTTTENSLLQHFKGWFIKTKENTFDPNVGTLMDFSLKQKNGATFMYVLPTSTTEALVEYTLFTKHLLNKDEYDLELKNYIKNTLGIDEYEISHTEFGVIPMSLANFSRTVPSNKRIINIGTTGGFTKASSGYTFQFIQKHTSDIIRLLEQNKEPKPKISFRENMYQWYDRTLLDVLISKKLEGEEVFSTMFKKVNPEIILAFLGNESSVWEDFKAIKCFPLLPFLTSGIKQLK